MMIWGCMTSNGVGDACWLEKGPDSQPYVEVLQGYVFLSEDYWGIDPEKFAFQQDNTKVHTANIVKEYFRKSKTPVFNWPVNSPDHNPIDNLWEYVKDHLVRYHTDQKA
jgi:hypothetical protein